MPWPESCLPLFDSGMPQAVGETVEKVMCALSAAWDTSTTVHLLRSSGSPDDEQRNVEPYSVLF